VSGEGGWERVLVVHAGALGDSVMVWPLLRALAGAGASVTFAARLSHARLASRCIDSARITPANADTPPFTRLWMDDSALRDDAESRDERYDAVLTFLADDSAATGRDWLAAAARRWPGAQIAPVGPPASESREALWGRARVADLGAVRARPNAGGPIVLHVGAGSPAKRWPLDRFIGLRDRLAHDTGMLVRIIAGEVEADRFTSPERASFAAAGGRMLADLDALAAELGAAALVVGNDSGPAHLAAQLGVPTLALFGPTDPRVWAPVGALVGVLGPSLPGPIDAIPVDAAVAAATDLLTAGRAFDSGGDDHPVIPLP